MTVKSRADLKTEADTNITTNGAGDVSGAEINAMVNNLADSCLTSTDDLAAASDINTGNSTAKVVTPDALAGSNLGTIVKELFIFDASQDCEQGDGAGDMFFTVPSSMDGMDLVGVETVSDTAGTTGTMDVQIHNVTDAVDMLSTKVTLASGDKRAADGVINASYKNVSTGDQLRVDNDTVHTTPAKGQSVYLLFRLP